MIFTGSTVSVQAKAFCRGVVTVEGYPTGVLRSVVGQQWDFNGKEESRFPL